MQFDRSCHAAFRAALSAALFAVCLGVAPARAEPESPQPILPQSTPAAPAKPDSPVVEQIVHQAQPPLVVRKRAARAAPSSRTRMARHHVPRIHFPRDPDLPALAGVELVTPLPPPDEPPHIAVPMPAYSLDSLVIGLVTPPPPIVCHRRRRDPDDPDPRLYREVPVACELDTP